MTPWIIFLILLALSFDFLNGFHDSANAIARKRYLGALQSSRGRGRGLRVGPEASLAERMEAFCSLLHEAEVGLREASRSGKLHDHCDGYFPLSNVAVKLASIVVLAMDVAVGEGVELGRAVLTYCAGEQT